MQPSKIDTLLNTMDSTSVNQPPKRKLLLSLGVSLSKEAQSKIQKLPGEICKHGNKLCSKKGMSLQCEVYYNWVHAGYRMIIINCSINCLLQCQILFTVAISTNVMPV